MKTLIVLEMTTDGPPDPDSLKDVSDRLARAVFTNGRNRTRAFIVLEPAAAVIATQIEMVLR